MFHIILSIVNMMTDQETKELLEEVRQMEENFKIIIYDLHYRVQRLERRLDQIGMY